MTSIRIFKYFSVYLNFLIIGISILLGGKSLFLIPFYVFILIPLLELFFGGTDENLDKAEEEIAKKDIKYDLMVWSVLPMQLMVTFLFLNRIADGSLAWWEVAGMIFAFGVSCGVHGINAAHELGHRSTWYEQQMSKMLLSTSLYMHFFIEHNRGHHKYVSTDEDPASARYGESLYAFWFRTLKGSWISSWHLENSRLKKDNQAFWSIHNEMLMFQVIQVALLTVIAVIWGWKVMLCFAGSSIIGMLLLETVNYIEHYGLKRKKIDDEYYDKVQPAHSWNSNHPIGRMMLFDLTRHSDHHYLPSRKYQLLQHKEPSPQMPTGYTGMMALAMVPPIWFAIMNREIEKYKATPEGAALA